MMIRSGYCLLTDSYAVNAILIDELMALTNSSFLL